MKNNFDKSHLTPLQKKVTQSGETEAPFTGEYLQEKNKGMYKCVVCGHPLFLSETKFDSGTGWPSFYKPETSDSVEEKEDKTHGAIRTEVICRKCGAHLGHVFGDSPQVPTGLRYCINSAALNFKKK